MQRNDRLSCRSCLGSKFDDRSHRLRRRQPETSFTALANGNYVFRVPAGITRRYRRRGCDHFLRRLDRLHTWPITPANALVDTSVSDGAIIVVNPLTNGNYVVATSNWDNTGAGVVNAGAAHMVQQYRQLCTGPISPANSLVGTSNNDTVAASGIGALTNGNYVVRSSSWDNGAIVNAGAATWCNRNNGLTIGSPSPANSLVGTTAIDGVGSSSLSLANGNYVVRSTNWNNGAVSEAGAVTWCDGVTGTTVGPVTTTNSLVGSTLTDQIGGTPYGIAKRQLCCHEPDLE